MSELSGFRGPGAVAAAVAAVGAVIVALFLPAPASAQTPDCGTILQYALSANSPSHVDGLDTGDVVATDNYVYALTKWGFLRSSVATPGSPGAPELQSAFHYHFGDNGKVWFYCDCHQGGTTFDVAEGPGGDSRMITDAFSFSNQLGSESTSLQSQAATLPAQAVRSIGGTLSFGQQVNVAVRGGSQLAAIYIGSRYYAYMSNPGVNAVKFVDLTTLTGNADSFCDPPFYSTCHNNPASAVQGTTTTLSGWSATAFVARQVQLSGQTRFLLVGTKGTQLAVAEINPANGQPTEKITFQPASDVARVDVANVNGRTFIFSAENSAGLRVYELTESGGFYSMAAVPQPAAFQGIVTRVVVRGAPGSPTPFIFFDKTGPSVIQIYDSGWLTLGGPPRLGKTLAHLGKNLNSRYVVVAISFGARVVQSGSTYTAYVYELTFDILGDPSDPSFEVLATPVNITCIAADPTAPAVASLLPVNRSAALRTGAEAVKNYYGDRWEMRDTTATGVPLTRLEWDLNVSTPYLPAQYAPDPPPWAMTSDGSVPPTLSILNGNPAGPAGTGIFWPCDPIAAGNPINGTLCNASVGGTGSGGSYALGIRTKNTNPVGNPTSSIYVNAAMPVAAPQARVANMVSGVVNILTGGQIDASISDGNIADATFNWSFTGCGSCPILLTGQRPNAPVGASGFNLTVHYGDGYQALVSGVLNQTDLVASFSLAPSSVLHGAPNGLALTNLMLKSPLATLNSVTWVTKLNGNPVPGQSGTLAASFLVVNGQALLTPPDPSGPYPISGYTVELTYTFTPSSGGSQNQTVSQGFTIVDWTPTPNLLIYNDAAATQPVFTFTGSYDLQIGIQYYLKDAESVPSGVTHPGGFFEYWNGTSFVALGQTSPPSGQGTVGFSSQSTCPNGCFVRVKVPAGGPPSDQKNVTMNTAQPLTVQVQGPTSGSTGTPLSFAASFAPASAVITRFEWDCDAPVGFPPVYVQGNSTQQCTYAANGNHVVAAKVTDSTGATASNTLTVTIGGGGGGGLSVTLNANPASPLKGAPVTFTAVASGGTGVYSYRWKPGEVPVFETWIATGSTPVFTTTYTVGGVYTASCETTSGGSVLVTTKTVTVVGIPLPSAAFTVSGATPNLSGGYDAEAGKTITFSALEVPANVSASGYAWDFGDSSTGSGRIVTHVFQATGARTVRLTVTGDGTSRAGSASSTVAFNIVPVSFQAMLVSSAEHSAVLQDPNGILKFWATDVSVANPGSAPVTISPAFLSFTATQGSTFDLATIAFDQSLKVTIPGGGQRSWVDIVKILAGDVPNKGTLVLKYEGGNATPLVTARVYFAPAADPLGPASGSALPSFRATSDGQVVTQGTQVATEQALPGLRGDLSYYFRMTLFNSSSTGGMFRVSAVDERGVPVALLDPRTGAPASGGAVDFSIGPYGAIDWDNGSLGLNDPTRRYVLKAHRTSAGGRLVASAAVRDRLTRDQVLVTSEAPPEFRENCAPGNTQQCVIYVVPGASRFQSATGAHWRTGLSIFNSSIARRGVAVEYHYKDTALVTPEKIAVSFLFLDPGQLIFYDDVVAQVFSSSSNNLADPDNGTAGVLRILHFADGETSTAPLIISARNYDDQPTGTVGSQLSVYTQPISIGPNEPSLRLAGVQADGGANPKPRFETILSVFSFDDTQTTVRLTAVKGDGTVLGFHDVVLNQPGAGGHFQPRNLNIPEFNAVVNEPITIKVDVMPSDPPGGRVGAYALIRDIVTRDPTYVQAVPQQ